MENYCSKPLIYKENDMDIKNDTRISADFFIHKNIEDNLPLSNKVDSRTFSILLEDKVVAASYKMY